MNKICKRCGIDQAESHDYYCNKCIEFIGILYKEIQKPLKKATKENKEALQKLGDK